MSIALMLCIAASAAETQQNASPIDMAEMLDPSTLGVEVLQDWHVVKDNVCPTRQKCIAIRVGELWPGQDYRIPVRMIVPADRKAKGFHLTGGHNLQRIQRDSRPRGVDADLIQGGVGLVHTIVQEPRTFGQDKLARAMADRFIKTLDPHYSIQYWAWPATLMRAVTAAHAETEHFEKGKVAVSGASKNGATPSEAILSDERMTAVHATVSPICDSPLRLCDKAAWKALDAYNKAYAQKHNLNADRTMRHPFLGGTFGPIYTRNALAAGHTWEEIERLANRMADHVFISRNLEKLNARGVDMLFHPGTHDFVAFDAAWCGKTCPQIPIYLRANTGHGKKGHPAAEKDEQNKSAFLLHHFFDGVEPLLESPAVRYEVKGTKLRVTVQFRPGSGETSGRIFWMFDRGPDGSAAYINKMIPDGQWKDMKHDAGKKHWTVEIELDHGASHIDFFSNHGKTLQYKSQGYRTYISSPYTRVALGGQRIR
ncbi:hypothetical protein HQ560_21215 [bacterium]|nr:hypothetical protein [bacterium]